MPIDYIVNSDKPFPPFIKEHRIFRELGNIEKIFPKIGLSNFTEQMEVYSHNSSKSSARQFVSFINTELLQRQSHFKRLLGEELLKPNSMERNNKCNKIQNLINILGALSFCIYGKDIISIVENKVVMLIGSDVFSGASSTPIFKKGEPLLRIINKINTQMREVENSPYIINYEDCCYFKDYSKYNIPSKEYKMTFASTGPDGAWDIATASMRGITSCQTWTSAQSRGLIGSITSKYVGIVYVSGTQEYPPYGKQMIFRMMVRLVINKHDGSPALFLDSMYPSYNHDMYETIKNILEKRSGLKVFGASSGERDAVLRSYCILNEHSRNFLREGEYSYMDTPLPVEDRPNILSHSNNVILTQRRKHFTLALEKIIEEKRKTYADKIEELKKYIASGEKDEKNKPKIVPAFQDLKKGKNSFQNTLNFFAHCQRNHSTTNKPTAYFLDEIFKAMGDAKNEFASDKECDMWMLRKLVNNYEEIHKKSWEVISKGSWMKAFPSSAKRFHETVLIDLKKELLKTCKGAV